MNENSLKHHGILGMRWGVRRSQPSSGGSKSGGKTKEHKPGSEDFERARSFQKRGAKNLSTKELQELTTRMNLEKQYKDLNPSDFKKGMNFVKAVTATGTTVASLYALSKTPLGQDIKAAVQRAMQ